MRIRVMEESWILVSIGLIDLGLTLALIGSHRALEGNPLMAYYLQCGVGTFVAAKLCLLFLPVFVAEWTKLQKPQFTRWMMRGAIAAYVGSYLVLFVVVNVMPRVTAMIEASADPPVRIAQHVR